VLALLVGAMLATAGGAYQGVFRNPLADPYLLGVSAGAALGVLLSYMLGYAPEPILLYTVAFLSGLAGFGVVLGVSLFMSLTPTGLIVAGVSVSYVLAGLSMVIISRLIERIPMAYSWLFGTVAYVGLKELAYTATAVALGLGVIALLARRVNTLMLGEDVSRSMGVNPGMVRVSVAVASSLAASSIVAIAGPVGFLGLAGPWMARMLFGSLFTRSLPAAVLSGGLLALLSDTTVRLIAAPGELPLTAVTAFYGGPILFYLTLRSGRTL
jgi:iron complex transport system permease protein